MARKTSPAKLAETIMLIEYRYEVATEAYEAQDEETQTAIKKIIGTLTSHSTGAVMQELAQGIIDMALFVLAMDVVKDLALLDIRVANFTFDDRTCVSCGGEV